MYRQQPSFQLKHSDISTNNTAQEAYLDGIGLWRDSKIETTWYIDLEKIVGYEMYNSYEKFALRLNQVAFTELDFAPTPNDSQLIARISGLNFVNCNYNIKTGNNDTKAILSVFNIPGTVAVTQSFSPNVNLLYFKKTTPRVALTIEFRKTLDDTPPSFNVNTCIPHSCFSFSVFPIL